MVMVTQKKIITVPGFKFAGVSAGIKLNRKKDLALIYSEVPAVAVGTFTQHPAAAAPVLLSKKRIRRGQAQAVVINSGNANASTGGAQGMQGALAMTAQVAELLGLKPADVLVCSTGVIGVPLPQEKIKAGIMSAARRLSSEQFKAAAQAILTTDQDIKVAQVQGKLGAKPYQLAVMAKGAGMIEPHMKGVKPVKHATMLAFAMTDLAVDAAWAHEALQAAVEVSFNAISVDGDTSTNDTCILLANGLVGNKPLKAKSAGAKVFQQQLTACLQQLAEAMVADGEGATKVVKIQVTGAKNAKEAKTAAYGIANSQLVRTAFFGGDPNWGRILAALGNSGATCRPDRVDILIDGVTVCRKGCDAGSTAERQAARKMQQPKFTVEVRCGVGKATHEILSSDLGYGYVKLNSHYRS